MAGVLGAASIPFIGCVSLLAGMILQILGYASPYWAYDDYQDFGLWRKARCVPMAGHSATGMGCWQREHPWNVAPWLDAVRGLESCTLVLWAIPLVVLPVYIYVALGLYYRVILGLMTLFTLLGAACDLTAIIVYGAKIGEHSEWTAGWSFIVTVVGCGLGFLAFVVLLISTCYKPEFTPHRHFVSGFYVEPDKNQLYVIESPVPPVLHPPKGSALP